MDNLNFPACFFCCRSPKPLLPEHTTETLAALQTKQRVWQKKKATGLYFKSVAFLISLFLFRKYYMPSSSEV